MGQAGFLSAPLLESLHTLRALPKRRATLGYLS
jgi:hypothetical protein